MEYLEVVKKLEEGELLTRKGWHGSNMFIFMQVPAEIDVETIVPKMQSLPKKVKQEFLKRLEVFKDSKDSYYSSIKYENQIALVKGNNRISGWSPSTADFLAKDWEIYKG